MDKGLKIENLIGKVQGLEVENMQTAGGNEAPNQFRIRMKGLQVFQSYDSIIAIVDYNTNTILFGMDWDYSRTTSKYLYDFLESIVHVTFNKKDIEYIIGEGQFNTRFNSWVIEYSANLR